MQAAPRCFFRVLSARAGTRQTRPNSAECQIGDERHVTDPRHLKAATARLLLDHDFGSVEGLMSALMAEASDASIVEVRRVALLLFPFRDDRDRLAQIAATEVS